MTFLRTIGLVFLLLVMAFPASALEQSYPLTLQNAAGATGNGTAIEVAGYTSVALTVTISATATVTFEGSEDGSTYASRSCVSIASTTGTGVTSATATGTYQCSVAGLSHFRARVSSFGSGTVTVHARATTAVARVGGGSGLPIDGAVNDCILNTAPGTGTWQACPGAAGGDAVSIDGLAVVNPNFDSAGDIDFVDTANVITANVKANSVALGTDTTGNYALGDAEGGAATTGDSATAFFSAGTIEDARLPTSMADKEITGSLNIPNATSNPGTCTIGQIHFDNDATAGVNLYGCTASNTWTLLGDGGGGSGTVTVVGAGSLTSTALVTGGGTTTLQTPAATATMDSSGNISTPGSVTATSLTVTGGGVGKITLTEGTCTAGGSASQHGVCVDSTTNRLASYENAGSQVNYVASGDNIGAATATTPSADDNDTSVATTAYVQTELTAYASDTVTFTTKTYNAESSGNVLTIPRRLWFPAAGCNNATAGSIWDLPTSDAAAAACITGTNTQKGVLDFVDAASNSAQITYKLPSTWSGTVDANIKWLSTVTSGNVEWELSTICVADAETDDPAFNTASAVIDATKGTTNQTNDAPITTVTVTGCAAGELMHIRILRDAQAGNGDDTLAGTARLVGVELVIREAI